ncbi:hypothetical protein FDP41_007887 [Naegleria fowleri]|uniref:Uncharacterized protein n=1 Tax=Naegleria fowleri TaxID=5763 RepID=A0A6A5CAG2_NAEFO|nr:uncharacterized protein FDP41_007887 [Naegleria fowleri]KAF0983972.1 hypothetical protein FDP41_007887 [Naegleria fowleri]
MNTPTPSQLERIRKDALLYPFTNYLFKITTNVNELLSSNNSSSGSSGNNNNSSSGSSGSSSGGGDGEKDHHDDDNEQQQHPLTILTPSPSMRYFLLHRDEIFKCWKGFIGIPYPSNTTMMTDSSNNITTINNNNNNNHNEHFTAIDSLHSLNSSSTMMNTIISPLIGMNVNDLCQDGFIHEMNHFEKPIEYHGYSQTIFSKLNISYDDDEMTVVNKKMNSNTTITIGDDSTTTTTTTMNTTINTTINTTMNTISTIPMNHDTSNCVNDMTTNSTIQYMEMNSQDISQFKKHFKSIYWFGFDCNHSLALNLFVLNRMSHETDLFEMLMELLENSPMDFIDVSPIEYLNDDDDDIHEKKKNSTPHDDSTTTLTTTENDNNNNNNIEIVRQMIDEYLPERSYKTFEDCLQLTHTLNNILYSYEEMKRQQQDLQLKSGKYIDLKSVVVQTMMGDESNIRRKRHDQSL